MWKTICEVSASCSGWNFGVKNLSLPWTGIWSPVYPHPPENLNLDRTWHFEFSLLQFNLTPPPTEFTGSSYVETNFCIPPWIPSRFFRWSMIDLFLHYFLFNASNAMIFLGLWDSTLPEFHFNLRLCFSNTSLSGGTFSVQFLPTPFPSFEGYSPVCNFLMRRLDQEHTTRFLKAGVTEIMTFTWEREKYRHRNDARFNFFFNFEMSNSFGNWKQR